MIVTVTGLPELVRADTVPRRTAPGLAATAYAIVAVAVPDEPEVTAIHDTSDAAVQLHAAVVVKVVLNVPPATGTDCVFGDSAYEHDEDGDAGDEL